jgi:hypothetical protein
MSIRPFRILAQTLLTIALFLGTLAAQTCSPPPTPPNLNTRNEGAADQAFEAVVIAGSGCMVAGDNDACRTSIADLENLSTQALLASSNTGRCAATGTDDGGAPLSAIQKKWYLNRSAFWLDLYKSLQQQGEAVNNGTYKISDGARSAFLGVAPQPKHPVITSKVVTGTSSITVNVDVSDFSPSAISQISVCVWAQKPNNPNAMDCTDPNSTLKAAPLSNDNVMTDANKNSYVPVTADGPLTLNLKTSLQTPQYVSIAQRSRVNGMDRQISSAEALAVGLASQCNRNPGLTPYSDCDMKFSIIAGVEQGAQSSLPSATSPFLSIFTTAPEDGRYKAWGSVRLLGAPQATSTNGVVSSFTDPAGNITTQTFSSIGTSLDFMIGGEIVLTNPGAKMYSVSLVAGYGGTTPLTANTLNQAFKAPAFGTVECMTLQSRFMQQFASDNIIAGTGTNAGATPSCLVNSNSVTSAAGAATTTYTPVTTIGFSNQDRSSFLGKALFGIRTIDRFPGSGSQFCGDADSSKQIGPCARGVVDFVFGQDASVTAGHMRHFVFKINAVHPLPVKSVSILYLFGSVTLRFNRNTNFAPLILQSGDVTALSGNGSSAVPNAAVVILPLTQPDRDFYRFGVGVDIQGIFKKLFSSPAPAAQ